VVFTVNIKGRFSPGNRKLFYQINHDIIGDMPHTDYSQYMDFITETVVLAGKITLGYFQSDLQPEYKNDRSPVTIADRKAEEFIRSRIEKTYPRHAIIGEEYGGEVTSSASHRWLIDPIDGTKSFMRGIPFYAVLLGLEIEGGVEVGAAYFPALDELIAAASGFGCWWNGRKARLSRIASLSSAYFSASSLQTFVQNNQRPVFDRLSARCYHQIGYVDAYGYLAVATGRIELMMDAVVSVWDCAPFPAIFREVGGYFGDWQGNETIYAGRSLATTRILLPEVLETIRDSSAGA